MLLVEIGEPADEETEAEEPIAMEAAPPETLDREERAEPEDPDPTYHTATTTTSESPRHYTVREGDWLVQIARDHYGSAADAERILEANRDRIDDPDRLVPGQRLLLPAP